MKSSKTFPNCIQLPMLGGIICKIGLLNGQMENTESGKGNRNINHAHSLNEWAGPAHSMAERSSVKFFSFALCLLHFNELRQEELHQHEY